MSYLKAVLNNDRTKEIENLKILIQTGTSLDKNVKKYEKELKKYNITFNPKKTIIEPLKVDKIDTIEKIDEPKISKIDLNNNLYTIESVEDEDNSIIVTFKTNISKDFVKFYEKTEKNAYQDIYDIKGNFKDAFPTKLSLDGVKQIVIKQVDPKKLQILFEDKRNLKTVYNVNQNILKISLLEDEKTIKNLTTKKSTAKETIPTISKALENNNIGKGRTIVLDAGHGGKDSGAVGGPNMYEKVSVFKITKYLEALLKKRGYKVYLTRKSDNFIKVKDRTVLANDKNADIFISIHANAVPKEKAHDMEGIETFFLSPARSERAKRVAALENSSDVNGMSDSSKEAFLETLNRPRITASHKLSIDIQKNMLFTTRQQHSDVVDSGVREGPFWVLVGAQMPSVLIEVGYITHPKEGKRLFQSDYQKNLALGIANGIDSYFAKNP